MNPAQKALWYIEAHLAEPLTLDDVAGVAGVSRFHLVRAFAAATGFSVMRYARVRAGSARLRKRSRPARRIFSASPLEFGLQLSRSFHPRVPRPFRRHA